MAEGGLRTQPGMPADYRWARMTLTFTGASGLGATNTNATIFTTTGTVLVRYIFGIVTTNLTGANSTVQLGTTNTLAGFIGATTATTMLTTANIWMSTTPTRGFFITQTITKDTIITENVLCRSLTADTTGGVLDIYCLWAPASSNGNLV